LIEEPRGTWDKAEVYVGDDALSRKNPEKILDARL
jgi:hypothetical protein